MELSAASRPVFCWLNGSVLPEDEARVSASGAGHLLGWGAFTTLGIFGARPFALPLHFQRLRHDCAALRLDFSLPEAEMESALRTLIERNEINDGMARLTLTRRGDGRWNTANGCDALILAHRDETLSTRQQEPCRVLLSPHRVSTQRATAGTKSTSYLDALLAWQQARDAGFDEALLMNCDDEICEAGRTNVFWEKDGEVFTPHENCGPLPGIGRALCLEWLRESNITCRQGAFTLNDLARADAAWLSSALGVRAVSTLFSAPDEMLAEYSSSPIFTALQRRWHHETRDL